jgi:hypothetical protein
MGSKPRSKCRHWEVCLYGTSDYVPLDVDCRHSHTHRQDEGCGKGLLCWMRYIRCKEQLTTECCTIRREHD